MPLQLIQIAYWLALSTWFGALFFMFVAAPVIFRTMKESKPLLPHVLSVNLEGQHGTLLAGTVIGNVINALVRIELICAGVIFLSIGAQWGMIDIQNHLNYVSLVLRSALLLVAIGIVLYDWRILWPKACKYRQEFIDNADDPDKANPILEQYDRYQRESFLLLNILAALLVVMVILSGLIVGASHTYISGPK